MLLPAAGEARTKAGDDPKLTQRSWAPHRVAYVAGILDTVLNAHRRPLSIDLITAYGLINVERVAVWEWQPNLFYNLGTDVTQRKTQEAT